MKKSKWFITAGVTLLAVSALAACGNKSSSSKSVDQSSLPTTVKNKGTAKPNATLNAAIVDSSGGTGIFMDEIAVQSIDLNFAGYVDETMFGSDKNLQIDDSGLASVKFDNDAKTVTVTLTGKNYKWSDGQSFTIDDYIFTIYQIGSKDYTGIRYSDGFAGIVGMADYHEGKTDTISGVEKKDDYTAVLHYSEMNPSMTYVSYLPNYVAPQHIFKDIPVQDWEKSDYARTAKFVGMGPYKIKSVVSGESVVYEANPNYYKGEPKTKNLKVDVVSPDTIAQEVKAGHYDITNIPSDQYDQFKDLSNVTLLGSKENTLHYLGFKLGKIEDDKRVMNSSAKASNVKLRQALAYALDNKKIGESVYNGLWYPATTLEISFFGDLHSDDVKSYSFKQDKAKKLLKEAGYKDTNNDGYVEDPKGKSFKLTLAAPQRGDAFESMIQQYIAWWKEIGVKVELYGGRTMEKNAFYEEVQKSDSSVDMFLGAFGTGFDPSPLGLWGPDTTNMNYTGFVSEKQNKLFKKLVSEKAMDKDYRIKAYKEWQEYSNEQLYAVPLFEINAVVAVNKRVKSYDTEIGAKAGMVNNIEVVSNKGVADK